MYDTIRSAEPDAWPKTLADALQSRRYRWAGDKWVRDARPDLGLDLVELTVRALPHHGYAYCLTYSPDTPDEESHDFWSVVDLVDHLWMLRRAATT